MKHGDFTGLAGDYARFRPGYAPQVAAAILSYVGAMLPASTPRTSAAGTGIWTRMVGNLRADC
jgi:purine-cytosine permease-like protein